MSNTIVRKTIESLQPEEKYKILELYSCGTPIKDISTLVNRESKQIAFFITTLLKELSIVHETQQLEKSKDKLVFSPREDKQITPQFIEMLETQAKVYAYYFVATNDNKFALEQSGLDMGVAKGMKKRTKDYIYRIRGAFIRDIPYIRKYIQEEQDKKISSFTLEKAHVQIELLTQIEELKELAIDDPKQRGNLLKAIELLGRTVASFTDKLETSEINPREGLAMLMKKVKEEQGISAYEKE